MHHRLAMPPSALSVSQRTVYLLVQMTRRHINCRFLPETLPRRQHSSLKVIYTPVLPIIGRQARVNQPHNTLTPLPRIKPNRQNPFPLFLQPNILLALVLNAMSYAIFFGIVTSLASLFETTYPFLNESQIGLCYLAIGGTMTLGTSFVGKSLDLRYRQEERQLRELLNRAGDLDNRLSVEGVNDIGRLPEFPIERVSPFNLLFDMVDITNLTTGST